MQDDPADFRSVEKAHPFGRSSTGLERGSPLDLPDVGDRVPRHSPNEVPRRPPGAPTRPSRRDLAGRGCFQGREDRRPRHGELLGGPAGLRRLPTHGREVPRVRPDDVIDDRFQGSSATSRAGRERPAAPPSVPQRRAPTMPPGGSSRSAPGPPRSTIDHGRPWALPLEPRSRSSRYREGARRRPAARHRRERRSPAWCAPESTRTSGQRPAARSARQPRQAPGDTSRASRARTRTCAWHRTRDRP